MSDDIRVGDLIEIRYGDTETRIAGRVIEIADPELVKIESYGLARVISPYRTVTVLERPEPPLPTEFGAHIVATIADEWVPVYGRQTEAVCQGRDAVRTLLGEGR